MSILLILNAHIKQQCTSESTNTKERKQNNLTVKYRSGDVTVVQENILILKL